MPDWPVNKLAMAAENPKIHAIYRYPVKGLSPEPLERAHLAVGATLPHPATSPSSAISC